MANNGNQRAAVAYRDHHCRRAGIQVARVDYPGAGVVMPTPPELEFAFEAIAEIGAPLDLGITPHGRRRVIPVLGGRFEGPAIRGRILPGGADWQLLRADGTAELDARYTLETDKGALIYVSNRGLRHGPPEVLQKLNAGKRVDPASYYFRTVAQFETGSAECRWLTEAIFISSAERFPEKVIVRFWKVA